MFPVYPELTSITEGFHRKNEVDQAAWRMAFATSKTTRLLGAFCALNMLGNRFRKTCGKTAPLKGMPPSLV